MNTVKPKILYLMHVDWCWIKQRPHFFAENLSAEFDVIVLYLRAKHRANLVANKTHLRKIPMLQLRLTRFKLIAYLNDCIREMYLYLLIAWYKPDVVWLPFPTLVSHERLKAHGKVTIVYDCMDDGSAFTNNEEVQREFLRKELSLLQCADLILVSSQNLSGKVLRRGISEQKVELIRNAFNGRQQLAASHVASPAANDGVFKILYVGTISGYLDMPVLLHCLAHLPNVEFHFVGPVDIPLPQHERMKFHGPVEHARLGEVVQQYDCFIMPFVPNELVQSVDPVKLYEYINFNKNIISIYYPEVARFGEFVHFYNDGNELVQVINNLFARTDLKYNAAQRAAFLQDNTWQTRSAGVAKILRYCLRLKQVGKA